MNAENLESQNIVRFKSWEEAKWCQRQKKMKTKDLVKLWSLLLFICFVFTLSNTELVIATDKSLTISITSITAPKSQKRDNQGAPGGSVG